MMTDTEIIKALECCLKATTGNDCEKLNCPALTATDCVYLLSSGRTGEDAIYHGIMKDALDLINRQKAKIKKLKEQKKLYLDRWQESLDFAKEDRAEEIREFAKRLKANKDKLFNYIYSSREFDKYIDNLTKEMTEDSNE